MKKCPAKKDTRPTSVRASPPSTKEPDARYASARTGARAPSPSSEPFRLRAATFTLRVTKVFWGLDSQLAYQRHFPAINWLNSYSLYAQKLGEYWDGFYDGEWSVYRTEAMSLLEDEDKLKEIVRLVGVDALSKEERMVLETSKSIREDFLHQNSFHEIDTYASMDKQFKMLRNILTFHSLGMQVLRRGGTMRSVFELPIREEISRMRYTEENDLAKLDELETRIKSELGKLLAMGGEHDEVA